MVEETHYVCFNELWRVFREVAERLPGALVLIVAFPLDEELNSILPEINAVIDDLLDLVKLGLR